MQPSELLLRFVNSVARPEEAALYLSIFRSEAPERFATIRVSEVVAVEAADALAVDLHFLARLGLSPVLAFAEESLAKSVQAALEPFLTSELCAPDRAADAVRRGRVPLVTATGLDDLARLAGALVTRKVIFLEAQSGLFDRTGRVRSIVDVTADFEELTGELDREQAALLAAARRLIERVPGRLAVAVTSPLDLLRELFTVRGAGSLIRRGATVTRYDSYAELDVDRLRQLIHQAFGRALTAGFFDGPVERVYIADDYRGAAIVAPAPQGSYLSKFAVDARARGEGIGRDLWRALDRDLSRLIWRARPQNPIATWYQQQCEGMLRLGDWQVFWRGLAPDDIAAAISHARSAPVDFDD